MPRIWAVATCRLPPVAHVAFKNAEGENERAHLLHRAGDDALGAKRAGDGDVAAIAAMNQPGIGNLGRSRREVDDLIFA